MVGYPLANSQYMFVKTIFNPSLKFGGQIQVADSQVVGANGKWTIASLVHELESITPNGKWFSTCGVFPSAFTE